MTSILGQKIKDTEPRPGQIALFYLGQAGFVLKTSEGKVLIIDAYLSDAAERLFGFKRMIPALIQASDLQPDFYLSTHEHIDHLDLDTIQVVAEISPQTHFIGASDCEKHYRAMGIPLERVTIFKVGQRHTYGNISVYAIYADHGTLAPDAVGYLIEVEGMTVYHAGDTAYRPREIMDSLPTTSVDILIVPINGQYGNMNAAEACDLAWEVSPSFVIPAHFWMFLEHVGEHGSGDPATFLKEANRFPHDIHAHVMAPGEMLTYPLN